MSPPVVWYARRLSRMGPREVAWRVGDELRKRRWRRLPVEPDPTAWLADRRFTAVLDRIPEVPEPARDRLVATAEQLLSGRGEYFGVTREDLASPDWFLDPRTGRRAPQDAYAFDVPYRREDVVGDIKQIWEPSRHQHLTVLAAAYALTGADRYAIRVAEHLKSWWAANPPLRGVHWTSGIELGIRLLSWVWVRRLLSGWPGVAGLFEDNPDALHQIWWHQRWLAEFTSRGSSANNHVVAEAAGQLAAASGFAWFADSACWRADAVRMLDEHLRRNTFLSGLNREQASEYHGLVLELGIAAAVEAATAGVTVPQSTWLVLLRMTDALAATVDSRLRPPRQGDGDDGVGLVLDGAGTDRWASLLATGSVLFGRKSWWPKTPEPDVRTALLAGLAKPPRLAAVRPSFRPAHFPDAGLTIMRSGAIWCRCDGGPHGFLSIAAHAHADALSVEVRHGGVDVLADPGTFCYHGEPAWRSYFRSTLGHNTVQLDGVDQSTSGGPFLWTRHAESRVLDADIPENGPRVWRAEHNGYLPAVHRRSVRLVGRELTITDEIRSPRRHRCALAFHLGPDVDATLTENTATLRWPGGDAVMALPDRLKWTTYRGWTDPPLGWYSAGLGRRQPATTLLGTGDTSTEPMSTVLRFTDRERR